MDWQALSALRSSGRACFVRRVISHTEKTRYLFHIARGVESSEEAERSFEVSQRVPPEELRIPLSQFIYVGDGLTDIPCFSLVEARNGVAIGVSKTPRRSSPSKQRGDGVGVDALTPADYRPGGALSEALHLALASVCQRIALRQYHAAQESP